MNPEDSNFALWVMVFLLGFFPHLPVMRQIEENYRQWFHQRAFIPAEAKALVHHLLANPAFFKPDDRAAQKVIRKYGQGMPAQWGRGKADNRLSSKWFRLVYLQERFEQWRSQPQIERFVGHCEQEYKVFQEQFRQLNLDVQSYIQRRDDQNGAPNTLDPDNSLQQFRIPIMRQVEKLLGRVCEFVACGVLATERIHNRRIAKLNYFGLFPTYEPGVPIVLDIVLKNAVVVFLITTLTSMVYIGYRQSTSDKPLHLTAGFVVYYLAALSVERNRLKDAFTQGLGTGVIGLVSCLWAFDNLTEKWATLVYVTTTCLCIGGAIGYLFPWAYRRRVAAIYQGPERRRNRRIFLVAPSELRSAGEALDCDAVNLSANGARRNPDQVFQPVQQQKCWLLHILICLPERQFSQAYLINVLLQNRELGNAWVMQVTRLFEKINKH